MFRKQITLASLFVAALTVAACNNVTAPEGRGNTSSDPGRGGDPATYDKACIDDLREVVISGPAESRKVYEGDNVMVTWEANHVCGQFTARVQVSYDGGASFRSIGESKNALSMKWHVPNLAGARVVLRVRLTDGLGELVSEQALASPIASRNTGGGPRIPPVLD